MRRPSGPSCPPAAPAAGPSRTSSWRSSAQRAPRAPTRWSPPPPPARPRPRPEHPPPTLPTLPTPPQRPLNSTCRPPAPESPPSAAALRGRPPIASARPFSPHRARPEGRQSVPPGRGAHGPVQERARAQGVQGHPRAHKLARATHGGALPPPLAPLAPPGPSPRLRTRRFPLSLSCSPKSDPTLALAG